jgi:tRNA U34 5-carboxymethylaminomethyl modifying GTPase MnmE/TrmE
MNLTRKAISERVKEIDVVIEVLDARLPGSSSNPLLQELTGHKPRLQVLNKQDLADAERTPLWLDWYNAQSDTRAIALDASEPAPTRRLIEACKLLAPQRGGMAKPMRVLICGIPNVGKSTLINSMSGKKQAKTGDEAGITKLEQRIVLADDSTCGTRPACCGRASSSSKAATTWRPAAPWAATPMTRNWWRWSCWAICKRTMRTCWRRATGWAWTASASPRCMTTNCWTPSAASAVP